MYTPWQRTLKNEDLCFVDDFVRDYILGSLQFRSLQFSGHEFRIWSCTYLGPYGVGVYSVGVYNSRSTDFGSGPAYSVGVYSLEVYDSRPTDMRS